MEAFAFTDLLGDQPARRVRAKISMRCRDGGGRDVPGNLSYRPNHNFGSAENRSFYIGQIDLPPEGLRVGESHVLQVTFLSGPGLQELLQVGRQRRIQEGARFVATAEILEVEP
jgi:hypothetical protein